MISPDEFGKSALFSLMQSLFLLIILLGLDQAFVRFFNSKEYEKKVILVNSITPSFLFCFFVVLGIIIFAKPFSQWLFGQNELFLMVLLCFYLPALIINRFALLVIRMDLRGKLYSILSVLSQVVNFISLVLLLVFFERSFRAIIIAEIIEVLVNTAIAFYFTKGLWTFQKKYLDSILTKKLLTD